MLAMAAVVASATWFGLRALDRQSTPYEISPAKKGDKQAVFAPLSQVFTDLAFQGQADISKGVIARPIWPIPQACSTLTRSSFEMVEVLDTRQDRCLLTIGLLKSSERDIHPPMPIGSLFLQYQGDVLRGGRTLRLKINLFERETARIGYDLAIKKILMIAETIGFELDDDVVSFLDRGRSFRMSRRGVEVDFLQERLSENRYNLIFTFEEFSGPRFTDRFSIDTP
ncbi:MAG: DUF6030 family protein [Pseudomonadota bacterium]